jgi:hypothetical protein
VKNTLRLLFNIMCFAFILYSSSCSLFRLAHSNPNDPQNPNWKPPAPGTLTAYYPFNGNAHDASGNGHDGTVYNATITNGRFGNASNAYYFNGVNAYIDCNLNVSVNSNYTVIFWMKDLSASNAYRRWVTTELGIFNTNSVVVRELDSLNGGGCQIYSGTQYMTSAVYSSNKEFWKDGNWHMFAYVSDGVVSKMSYDAATVMVLSNSCVPQNGFYIGGYYNLGNTEYFYGMMDDVRVFGAALNDSELAAYYHENGW